MKHSQIQRVSCAQTGSDDNSTIVDIIRQHAKERSPQNMATWLNRQGEVVDQMSFGQLHRRASALAARLAEARLNADNGVCEPNSTNSPLAALIVSNPGFDFIVALVACFYAGVAAVPAYPLRRKEERVRFESVLADSGAQIVLADESNHSILNKSETDLDDCELVRVNYRELDVDTTVRTVEFDAQSIALIQYTSGSTGQPKGVLVTHHNLMSNQRLIKQAMDHDESLIVASWLPMFHDMGLIGNLLQPLFVGGQGIYLSPLDFIVRPFRWLQAISEHRVTSSGGPDFGYQHCIDRISTSDRNRLDLSSWRNAYNGSEPVNAGTLRKFADTFSAFGFTETAFLPCYGMAETTLFVSGVAPHKRPNTLYAERNALRNSKLRVISELQLSQNSGTDESMKLPANDVQAIVSCGEPLDSVELKIVEPNTRRELSEGEVGEIWVAGDSVSPGYKDRSELNRLTFQAQTADLSESDAVSSGQSSCSAAGTAFLRTGDLGFMWKGELYVSGRLKELIVIRGRNHYPHDIEQTLRNSDERLKKCNFAAVAIPSDQNELLGVVVSTRNSEIVSDDHELLQRRMVEAISRTHDIRLHQVVFTDNRLPVTTSGKTKRLQCCSDYFPDN